MPNIRSAYKALRQDKKRHAHNKAMKTELGTLSKKARKLIEASNKKEADIVLKTLESKLDKAAKTNVIKKNNASRRISRLRAQWAKIEKK